MSLTVRTPGACDDRWRAIPGETRWVDYSCQQVEDDLVVFVHTFRRARERHDGASDVPFWKPGTTSVARQYAAGDWLDVVDVERDWPPTELTRVARRRRGGVTDQAREAPWHPVASFAERRASSVREREDPPAGSTRIVPLGGPSRDDVLPPPRRRW